MLSKALQILKTASIPGKTVTRDTQIFKKLMNILDHPYKSFKSIHITGTNGKGSTTMKIASVLQQAGYKTGMYTSPHIFDFMQRIKINRTNIEDDYFAETILRLNEIQKKNNLELTFFQYLTATAFLYYKDKKCDFASVQVGLGGRYDTTNVILPEVSVITSIALDHQRILGSTRQQIAFEKAGIIKPSRPVVVGPNAELPIIFQQAKKQNSKVYLSDKKTFDTFDEQNTSISRMTLQVLKQQGINISNEAMQKGLKAQQPCRMQIHDKLSDWCQGKRVIFDVGHNPNAITKIIEYFNKKLRKDKNQKVGIVFGASKDKNVSESLGLLQQFADLIYLVKAQNHYRAMQIQQLSAYVGQQSKKPQKFRLVGNGEIHKAMTYILADKDISTVIVCGSFYIMPEAKSFLHLGQIVPKERNISEQYDMKNPNSNKP